MLPYQGTLGGIYQGVLPTHHASLGTPSTHHHPLLHAAVPHAVNH